MRTSYHHCSGDVSTPANVLTSAGSSLQQRTHSHNRHSAFVGVCVCVLFLAGLLIVFWLSVCWLVGWLLVVTLCFYFSSCSCGCGCLCVWLFFNGGSAGCLLVCCGCVFVCVLLCLGVVSACASACLPACLSACLRVFCVLFFVVCISVLSDEFLIACVFWLLGFFVECGVLAHGPELDTASPYHAQEVFLQVLIHSQERHEGGPSDSRGGQDEWRSRPRSSSVFSSKEDAVESTMVSHAHLYCIAQHRTAVCPVCSYVHRASVSFLFPCVSVFSPLFHCGRVGKLQVLCLGRFK